MQQIITVSNFKGFFCGGSFLNIDTKDAKSHRIEIQTKTVTQAKLPRPINIKSH